MSRENTIKVGQKFGKLTVIENMGTSPQPGNKYVRTWRVKCECGVEKIISGTSRLRATGSCGCGKFDYKKNIDPADGTWHYLYLQYKKMANERDLEFSLTEDECREMFTTNCYYCGSAPRKTVGRHRKSTDMRLREGSKVTYNGIDRVNTDRGYTVDNTVTCCYKCNFAKHTQSVSEFREWIKQVYDYQYSEGA